MKKLRKSRSSEKISTVKKNKEITTQKNNETKKKSSEIKSKHLKTPKIMKTQKKIWERTKPPKKTTQQK